MSQTNAELEQAIEDLPDKCADALLVWRRATIERETKESELFIQKKSAAMNGGGPSGDDYIKCQVKASPEWREVRECEAAAEACFQRLNERLMGVKKTISIRTAF